MLGQSRPAITSLSLLSGALLAGVSTQANAIEGSLGLGYADYDEFGSGFNLEAELTPVFGLGEMDLPIRAHGSFSSVDELDILAGRLGYLIKTDAATFELGGGYQFWDYEQITMAPSSGLPVSNDDVWTVHGRVEWPVTDAFVLGGGLEYLIFDNFNEETPMIGLSAEYRTPADFSIGLDVEIYTDEPVDQTFFRLGARWYW